MASQGFVMLPQRAHQFWRERTAREQRLLLATVGVLLLGAVFMLLIIPALDGRHQWQQALPQLRAERSHIQALAKQLGSTPPPSAAVSIKADRVALERTLTDAGIKPASLEVSDDRLRARWVDISFSALNQWLDNLQREQGWSVDEASINATASVDRVDAMVSLRWLRSSP
jgi:general secretion pathway protein M